MKKYNDFLFELLTEELPPNDLHDLSLALTKQVEQGLLDASLSFHSIDSFATPRRLAVIVNHLSAVQPDQTTERRGPPYDKAFNQDGSPTDVAVGFAKTCGVDVKELRKLETGKGCWIAYQLTRPGRSTIELLPEIVMQAIQKLPIKRAMRWGSREEAFSRPVHAVVMLYGSQVVPATILGILTSNQTAGHRFLCPTPLTIKTPKHYEAILVSKGFVQPRFEERKKAIEKQLLDTADRHHYLPVIDDSLLEQVTGLVEWPVVLIGEFPASFLTVPKEVLISSMQHHQRCFPLTDEQNHLVNHFLMVSNLESKHPGEVVKGNERVMNARLSDAAYFYALDLSQPLERFIEKLTTVVFQAKLGTLFDKTKRLETLAEYLASQLKTSVDWAKQAAYYSKADLVSSMVGEFPELQGLMGYYYTKAKNYPSEVSDAIREQYMPYNAEAELPASALGQILSLADRVDTLLGIFGIDKKPTGDKDPFGLRRAALGMIRLLAVQPSIDLLALIDRAKNNFGDGLINKQVTEDVQTFIYERLKHWLFGQGFSLDQVASIDKHYLRCIPDFIARLNAVKSFCQWDEARNLAAANKRVCHLLNKESFDKGALVSLDDHLLHESAEISLVKMIVSKENEIKDMLDYSAILKTLSELSQPIDDFFDQVMVMAEDLSVRKNRLVLLHRLRQLFLRVADISLLQWEA